MWLHICSNTTCGCMYQKVLCRRTQEISNRFFKSLLKCKFNIPGVEKEEESVRKKKEKKAKKFMET